MPRGERPLDPGHGVLLEFARDLRRLRQQAGSPTYRELSARAHYSAAALSEAANGRKLPSLAVTLAYVAACGGDRALWEPRWRQVAAELTAPQDIEPEDSADEHAPYMGLTAFRTTDADRFFGRDELIDELVRRVRERRFLGVFGSSGSGKSSVLRAGLIAHLEQRDVVLFTPGANPIEECAVRLAGRLDTSPGELRAEFAANPTNVHLRIRQSMADRSGDVTIVVDQFEEIFMLAGEDERAWLIAALTTAASAPTSRARIVLGVRADFYAHCAEYPELVEALRDAQVLVGPMTADQLRQAITLPAERAGFRVETALVSRLIADATGQPGVLPLVSHALLETWHRRRGTTLALSAYEASGGIQHAVARTAEHVYSGLAPEERDILRRIVLRLVAVSDSDEVTKRRVRRAEVDHDGSTASVLETMTRARLIAVDNDHVELAHEALIENWPRLRGWLDEGGADLRTRRQLIDATSAWLSLDRDSSTLYRGTRLAIAEGWAARHDADLTPTEREFVDASLAARAREATLARRRVRRVHQLVAVLLVLVVVASVAVVNALRAQRIATDQQNAALANKVVSHARAIRTTNPPLALQLALAAYRLHPSTEGRDALYELLGSPYAGTLTGYTKAICDVAVSADGNTLAVAGLDQATRMWDRNDPSRRPRELSASSGSSGSSVGSAVSVAFSSDGRWLVTIDRDGSTYLWSLIDRVHPRLAATLWKDDPRDVAGCGAGRAEFDPTGKILVTAHPDGIARFWNLADFSLIGSVPIGPAGGASPSVAFGAAGRVLVVVGADANLRMWDLADPTKPRPLPGLPGGAGGRVSALAVSADGRILAIANDDMIQLWGLADPGSPPRRLAEQSGTATYAIAFSRNGKQLATSGRDGATRIWNLTDPYHLVDVLTVPGHTGDVRTAVFSPDGQTLITGAGEGDATVRLTDVSPYTLTGSAVGGGALAFRADSKMLAITTPDRRIHLRDRTDDRHPTDVAVIDTGTGLAGSLNLDGQLLATADTDHKAHLWDITTTHAAELAGVPGLASMVTLSPNRRFVVTTDPQGTSRLWDITEPRGPVDLHVPLGAGPVTWSSDSRLLVTMGEKGSQVWDITEPGRPKAAVPLGRPINFAVFSPDNRVLVTVEPDTTRIWDISDLDHPRSLATIAVHTTHNPNSLNASVVAFHPEGHTLALATSERTTQLLDLTDPGHPEPIAAIPTQDGSVTALAFSSDGRTLATITDRSTVQLWDANLEALAAHICRIAQPGITPDEWNRYVPNVAYRPPCS